MKGVAILGATGTIGVNTLDVLARHREDYRVIALTAHSQHQRLAEQCLTHVPDYAVMVDADAAEKLQAELQRKACPTRVLQGADALARVAALPEVDIVMAAIVGAAGLSSTIAAARAGKRILLANKESLVMSGKLFMDEVREHHAELLPIDSEHNAIFQCMPSNYTDGLQAVGVEKILLTGSGGPFRDLPLDKLAGVTPEQAIAHPNWNMGKKISVDSATMMNKGLELIEACWLFDTSLDNIEVVLHPQSIIHSMVEYIDGSVIAQLGQPDMRTPIAHALAWPQRISSGVKRLDLFDIATLSFNRPDEQRYPCLQLARQAMQTGGTATTILNAANEIAVQAFLDRKIRFTDIAATVEYALGQCSVTPADSLETIVRTDRFARDVAHEFVNAYPKRTGASFTS
ncbi:MAG: 1-deoxy-D-xylulose-5-phosphate reductoisomerase [Gammaproteobacteria bacterium]|nr:1-deoxy-D-xylulose-5-phosphate reductoisomerase [Gammaproteobacteria bacterium]